MRVIVLIVLFIASSVSYGAVSCPGKIKDVYKWDYFETISVRIEMSNSEITPWLSLPTKSDESMALMAFTTERPVSVYMAEESVTSCVDGWPNNKKLKGYFIVQ